VVGTAQDFAGSIAVASFEVTVVDTTPPVFGAIPDVISEATSAAGANVTLSATAHDIVDGDIAATLSPASGSTFALGTTSVTATATDSSGNTASKQFNVTVQDTTPPTLTLPGNLVFEATSAAGAVATFTTSAYDLVSGNVTVTSSPASGSTFALGTTTVNASAQDAVGNTATGSFTVTVRDTTAPVITAITATPAVIWPPNKNMVAVQLTAYANDAVGVQSLSIESVDCNETIAPSAVQITGPLTLKLLADRDGNGTGRVYTIHVVARDSAGNTSTQSVTVTVPHDNRKT
jgi:hypothetical protein